MPIKPDKKTKPKAYRAWVRAMLKRWDPADDKGDLVTYVPRHNGVKAADVENDNE